MRWWGSSSTACCDCRGTSRTWSRSPRPLCSRWAGFWRTSSCPSSCAFPGGGRTFREYLDDIRLTRTRPFVPLLILTVSCDLILILCQGTGSLAFRLTEGQFLTWEFVRRVFDLSSALPPQSTLLFAVFFSSFEEVVFRGIFLTMLLEKHPSRRAIVYSAIAFGVLHLPAVLAGHALIHALGQVVWASLFGLFYGYLFIKSGSLLPPMIIHWLSHVFQAPLTAYWQSAPDAVDALYGVVFGHGLATFLLLLWVRFLCPRWLTPGARQLTAPPGRSQTGRESLP